MHYQQWLLLAQQDVRVDVEGFIPLILIVVIPLLALASLGFWLWMLIDCIKNEPSTGNDKIIWVVVILVLQFLGALLYLIIRRPQRIRDTGH